MNELEVISQFAEIIPKIKREVDNYKDKLKNIEDEICDIQHILGVPDNKLTAPELVQLAIELRKKLQERWELKHRNRIIKPVYYFIKGQRDISNKVLDAVDNMESAKEDIENLVYYPRVRNDLANKFASNCDGIVKIGDINLEDLKDKMESNNAI